MLREAAARLRSLSRGLRGSSKVDREMEEEMRFHIEMEAQRLTGEEGLDEAEAMRRSRLAFGGVDKYREAGRDARGLTWFSGAALDFRLGFRMLRKYPGITVVGGLAMAFGICVGVAAFEFLTQMTRPTIPLPDGDRIVGVQSWDVRAKQPERRVARDLLVWRESLRAVEQLSAFRTVERNLASGARVEPVQVAEMSASGFTVARTAALRGRVLTSDDERPGAAAVVVLGYDLWQRSFNGDAAVIGRVVHLDGAPHTVVGIMPEGFRFPVSHALWTPLHHDALQHGMREGPAIHVMGRLAEGSTLAAAHEEARALGRRMALAHPHTHAALQAEVRPYAQSVTGVRGAESVALFSVNIFLLLLLVLVCANVALLMFARAATREAEIIVRSALGASRGRVVMQLFAEALVLGVVAAVAGLFIASRVLHAWMDIAVREGGGQVPFWFHPGLSPASVAYTAFLTIIAAAVAGVLPAMRVTREIGGRMREMTAGAGGMRFGGVWTAVIVAQIAVTIAFPATAYYVRGEVVKLQNVDLGPAAAEYLVMRVGTSDSSSLGRLAELERRLEAEDWTTAVTLASRVPGTHHPARGIEVEGGSALPLDARRGHRASPVTIGADFFDTMLAQATAGRLFSEADIGSEAHPIVVNDAFVREIMGGRSPLGRRVRLAAEGSTPAGDWYPIVGVVRDLGVVSGDRGSAGMYHLATTETAPPSHAILRVRGATQSVPQPSSPTGAERAARIRTIASEVDARLRVHDITGMRDAGVTLWLEFSFLYRIIVALSLIAMLLSLAGIYAVMAFTVARRTREIGIRVALGASAARIVASVFRGPLIQVGAGVAGGAAIVALMAFGIGGGKLSATQVWMVLGYSGLMTAICMLACVVPAHRALRVEPTEALRSEA